MPIKSSRFKKTLSDHRMFTLHLSKREEKIGGPGYWQHPDHSLKDQYYTDTIDFALDAGLEKCDARTRLGESAHTRCGPSHELVKIT
jgi:hypothetical protein